MVRIRRTGWALLLLGACTSSGQPMEWKSVEVGLLSGIQDGERGWVHLPDAFVYHKFRRTHERVVGKSRRDTHGEPLRDLDFREHEYVIVWVGTTQRALEIVGVSDGVVRAKETLADYDENSVQRLVFVGPYQIVSLPRTGEPVQVVWID